MATTQGIKLDDNTQKRLKALGEARHRSSHWIMRTAIETYLDHAEHYENEKNEDMQRYEHYQLTGKAIDQSAVEAWLKDLAQGKITPCPQ